MRAGQTLVDDDGYQVALFPLEYMNISQGEGGSYSHSGSYAIDFLGWGANGRVYNCPCYAPVDLKCVYASSNSYRIFESLNKVHLADGTLSYLTIWFNHGDHNSSIHVGDIFRQGEQCNETGTTGQGVTGDHTHIICGLGKYQGQKQVNDNWTLKNQMHSYNALFVNDTVLVNDYNYNWKTYSGGTPTPPTPSGKKYRFKWVLYANKLRNR